MNYERLLISPEMFGGLSVFHVLPYLSSIWVTCMMLAMLFDSSLVSPTAISSGVAVVGALATIFLGSGAASFFLRYHTRMTLVENKLTLIESANLNNRVTSLESNIQEIHKKLIKLDSMEAKMSSLDMKMNSVDTKLDIFIDEIRDFKAQIVPRHEHEARWQATEARITALAEAVNRNSVSINATNAADALKTAPPKL